MADKKISIIGIGRLGLSFALLCDKAGYKVCGCDVSKERTEQIKNKTLKTSEPQIEALLEKSNLHLTDSLNEAVMFSDLIFLFVATPSKENGEYDHSQIENVIKEIVANIGGFTYRDKTIVISCTVMPKYCGELQKRLAPKNINVVYNPEFIAQGNIITGLRYADIILFGGDEIPGKLYNLYGDIMETTPVFKALSHTGAELAKISINCFLTLKTAYANLIGEIAIESGEEKNIAAILDAIGGDDRIGNKYMGYGFPASGICLPRDLRALKRYTDMTVGGFRFISEITEENNRHLKYLKAYHIKNNPSKDTPFIFSFITYKAGTDITIESKPLELCLALLEEGYTVYTPPNTLELDIPHRLREFHYEGQLKFGTPPSGHKVN